jgi:hypothetical protein
MLDGNRLAMRVHACNFRADDIRDRYGVWSLEVHKQQGNGLNGDAL